jgi:hypothetical protein
MKLSSEPRDLNYTARCDTADRKNRSHLAAARRLWGIH